jgi:hypothetical protein
LEVSSGLENRKVVMEISFSPCIAKQQRSEANKKIVTRRFVADGNECFSAALLMIHISTTKKTGMLSSPHS